MIEGLVMFIRRTLFSKNGDKSKCKNNPRRRRHSYRFEVMVFKLKIMGVTFQRMVDNILVNLNNVRCHIHDVVIKSVTKERYIICPQRVFALLLKRRLRLRLKKCSFIQPCIELLDHYTEKEGNHSDRQKKRTARDAFHEVHEKN